MDISANDFLKAPVLNDARIWTGESSLSNRIKHLGILVSLEGYEYLQSESAVILSTSTIWPERIMESTLLEIFIKKKVSLLAISTADTFFKPSENMIKAYNKHNIVVISLAWKHVYADIVSFFENNLYIPLLDRYFGRDEIYGRFLKHIGKKGFDDLLTDAYKFLGHTLQFAYGGHADAVGNIALLNEWERSGQTLDSPELEDWVRLNDDRCRYKASCKAVGEKKVFALKKEFKADRTLTMLKEKSLFSGVDAEIFGYVVKACEIQSEVVGKELGDKLKNNKILFKKLIDKNHKPDDDFFAELRQHGWNIGKKNSVCLIGGNIKPISAQSFYKSLQKQLKHKDLESSIPFCLMGQFFYCIFVNAQEEDIRGILNAVVDEYRIDSCCIGVGGIVGAASLPQGYEQARCAHRFSQMHNGGVNFYRSMGWYRLLLYVPDEELKSFSRECLWPLLPLSEINREELLPTLEAFLNHLGNYGATASELHMHINSIRYRIQSIENLLHVDFKDTETFLDYSIALHIFRLLRQ
ncbi:MAG: helix-turn-helix domain-containing protein [Bacillota bacterium]